MGLIISTQSKHGNWPKKSSAIALALVSPKSNALVIMHWFYEKSNALVEVIALV